MQLHYLLSKQLSSDKFRWPHKVPLLRQISHKRDFSSKEGYNDKKYVLVKNTIMIYIRVLYRNIHEDNRWISDQN